MSTSGAKRVYLAADLGASSGRVVAGKFDGSRLELEEVHRFSNGGVVANERLYWDILAQWTHVQNGLRLAAGRYGDSIASVGVDTWGVDFGLLGRGDELLGNPYHYRDKRTNGMLERAFSIVSRAEIFEATGLQFMELNTLYQLLSMRLENSPLLDAAESFLMIPDLLHWMMTGQKANEFTNVSTTQFYNPQTQSWATNLFDRFGLPKRILGSVVQPGTRLGKLRQTVAEESGLRDVEVVLPGTHDTASAVMAVPASSRPGQMPNWCYISSGTWSLMGIEAPTPIITSRCRELNFTNEGGVGGTTRVLKNIAGLWVVQESRRVWGVQGKDYSWTELQEQAAAAPIHTSLINPDSADFLAPRDMPAAIRAFCERTGQAAPNSVGAVIRTALESLALRYRMVLNWLEELSSTHIETIHIVGGGVQNELLCQMAADACGRRVLAGPIEATAIGNIMMQAVAIGDIDSIAQAREVIRNSLQVREFLPKDSQSWEQPFERFVNLVNA